MNVLIKVGYTCLGAILYAMAVVTLGLPGPGPEIPRCQEDTVLVGQGDFVRGQWSRYECGPALDDFTP